MEKIKIITDSCADLSGEQLEKYGIDYAKMCTVLNGQSEEALLTWSRMEQHNFFQKMREGRRFTTAQVPVGEFIRVFDLYLKEGYDIIYVACSSKQSGSVNTGKVVAKKMMENYPGRQIECIDSLNASIGEGMLAIEATKLVEMGYNFDAVARKILALRKKVNEYATVHSLSYLQRAGRVKATTAFLGNLMGVKPILISDAVGAQTPIKKVKGREASLTEIIHLMKGSIRDSENQIIYLQHADCSPQEVDALAKRVREEIPCKGVEIGSFGPILGASVGPDAIGIWAFGEEVTYTVQE
jgi:DegV family protein with EDD domain